MNFIEQFLLAIGLAMDAFSVSIYKGVKEGKLNIGLCITLGITFGLMQGLMPLLGYFLTSIEIFKVIVQTYSKYIIFVILLVIGGRMIIETISEILEQKKNVLNNENNKEETINENTQVVDNENVAVETSSNGQVANKFRLCFSKEIIGLGFLTSIDALAIGIQFTASKMFISQVLIAVSIIAGVSFIFSFFGCMFGKVLSKYIKNYAGIFGGIILILIGIKVLLGL